MQQDSGGRGEKLRKNGGELEEEKEQKIWGGARRAMGGAVRCLGRMPLSRTDLLT